MKTQAALVTILAALLLFSCTDLSNFYSKDEIDSMMDDQPVSFSVKLTSSYAWPLNATIQKINFYDSGSVVSNVGTAYVDSSSTFMVPEDGIYSFDGSVRFQSIAQGNMVYVYLKTAGTGFDNNYYGDWTYSSGTSIGLHVSRTLALSSGTSVQLWAYVNSSTPPALVYGNSTAYYFTSFSGARVR